MGWKDLEIIFEAVDCGVCILDATGLMIMINPGLSRHTSLPSDLFLNRHILSLYDQHHFERIPIGYRGLTEARTIRGLQKTRTGKTLLATATPVFGPNRKLKYIILDAREISKSVFSTLDVQLHGKQHQRDADLSREPASRSQGDSCFIAHSDAMADVMRTAKKVASTDATVLLVGESGVGKDVIAEFIWRNSPRFKKGGFIRLNCNSMPRDLVESELFGYTAGTFTGGRKDGKPGLLEVLSGGTLFLDEIADLPLELQGTFLDVLEREAFRRLGGIGDVYTDVRIITATNRNLWEMVENGLFRKDLYYRLNVFPIEMAPLRERVEDIPSLMNELISRMEHEKRGSIRFNSASIMSLCRHGWPGNVRELESVIERAMHLVTGDVLTPEYLPHEVCATGGGASPGRLLTLPEAERQAIIVAGRALRGNVTKMSDVLGIGRTTLWRKMRAYGITANSFKG